MHPQLRRRVFCFALAALTMAAGLLWRLAPMGLPPFWYKYGGSVLWAAMVYWIAAGMLPGWRPPRLAVACCLVAAAVELSRLYHTPGLDAFRVTLAGKLLLGRFFAVRDIAAYWLAIGGAALADRFVQRDGASGAEAL